MTPTQTVNARDAWRNSALGIAGFGAMGPALWHSYPGGCIVGAAFRCFGYLGAFGQYSAFLIRAFRVSLNSWGPPALGVDVRLLRLVWLLASPALAAPITAALG
jgi:hypothetical protein